MNARRYLVFKRVGRSDWRQHGEAEDGLSQAIGIATGLASKGWDAACVMEVVGREAVPELRFRWSICGRLPAEQVQ